MWKYKKFRQMEFMPIFRFLIEMYKPEIYVELGVKDGHTFNQISPLVKEAYAVDMTLMPSISRLDNVFPYQMTTSKFFKEWNQDKKIDLLFIDAGHEEKAVLNDFDLFGSFVREGTGIVLLHDTYPSAEYLLSQGWCYSAWKAADLIHRSNKYSDWEIFTFPGPYAGMSMLRNVKKGHLHWKK